jgi:SecD/SecF fusion protein
VDYQQMGQPVVLLEFDAKGAKMFYRVTSAYAPGGSSNTDPNRSRQLAIVLDGTLYSAPAIREAIAGGKAEISGSFTVPEATLLSNILRAGSLPAPVKVIERRVVDPTLGADSIKSGISAGLYGCGAIVVLMAGYYLLPGLLASLALLLNVLLLPIGMIAVAGILDVFSGGGGAASGIALPVLTLPGIAGIALSIGMAVDANVLIFERIREELRAGKTFGGAIQAGYQRAFTAIFDSNVTTIITAAILFVLGSGPVRGYAVTLAAGLLVSMFTAVVVTRLCFDAIGKKSTDLKLLRMMQLFSESKIDFMKWWKPALTVSLVIIIGAWAVMTTRGMQNVRKVFGVDFTGGSAVSMGFEQRVEVDAMRAALSEAGVNDAMIQYQGVKGGGDEGLQLKVGSAEDGALAAKTLAEKFPQAGFKVLQEDDVGPQVGGELKRKAMWAMLWSLVAMVIYISWRFEFGFALGAVVALFHDVLITAGIIHLMGFQISLTVVAALMTIVGYSVNDTIVIFDRIREDLRLIRNKSFLDICNLSMNQTLSRTILTNFLTFVSVLCLVAFGGSTLRDFSVTMFIGMIAGTYSTMYIATPVVLLWYRFKTPDLGSKSAG